MKTIKLTWKCPYCGDIKISWSYQRHSIDVCKCGKCMVDLEQWYQRDNGSPIELKREEIEFDHGNN